MKKEYGYTYSGHLTRQKVGKLKFKKYQSYFSRKTHSVGNQNCICHILTWMMELCMCSFHSLYKFEKQKHSPDIVLEWVGYTQIS